MNTSYNMKANFFHVANAYFDKDQKGTLNGLEMAEMEKVYGLHTQLGRTLEIT